MAAAEARVVSQRTGNCCFVQDDARRGPKLSCCPSSSSKSESAVRSGDAARGSDNPIPDCVPYNHNSANPNLPPDTKWWLNLQSNHGHQREFSHEQLNALEAELEVLSDGFVKQTTKLSKGNQPIKEYGTQTDPKSIASSFLYQPQKASATYMKNDQDGMQELKAVIGNDAQKRLNNKDTGEFCYADDQMTDLEPFNSLVLEQSKKLCSDLESDWIGIEKTEPWWRTSDKDELASLVSHKSLVHIENCDLPQPQTKHFAMGPSACPECFDHNKILTSSLDWIAEKGISTLADCIQGSPSSGSMERTRCTVGDVGCSLHDSDGLLSSTSMEKADTQHKIESDLSKAQLLEALCHSQTRAREAEKAAQQAYDEKEHVIKLFFRQASYLFAYKQWFQILQLEILCLQLKNKDRATSSHFPAFLPWAAYKGRKLRKGRNKTAKRKMRPPRYRIGKCAVAFAVGFSLAGAGLLLGWTMGWWLPAF
uniref:Uncharacterized protein n=1 Tax=Davidia involucrata TaxID=16924 RepID=A0A5B7BUV1_DAVIN